MNSWPFPKSCCEFGSLGCRKTLEKGHGGVSEVKALAAQGTGGAPGPALC